MALLSPGQRVSRYEILGRIAKGGMSEVYLARQGGPSGFSKTLVLKVILPTLAHDPTFVQMFHNEAKLAAMLNHPSVVQIFDFGVDDEIHYMTMEYIDGRNLGHIMRAVKSRKERLPIAIALRIGSDACGALSYAHRLEDDAGYPLELIHRDVSLENILVTYSGQVKLVDFGVAKARNLESYTQTGALKGKYNYMAPEMIEGKALDSRADIFSMGVVLYKLLVGRLPFVGENHAQLLHRIAFDDPPPPRSLAPDLPEVLEPLLLNALRRDREQRYATIDDLRSEIDQQALALGQAIMPADLSTFMTRIFPPGSDPTREQYRQLISHTATPTRPLSLLPPSGPNRTLEHQRTKEFSSAPQVPPPTTAQFSPPAPQARSQDQGLQPALDPSRPEARRSRRLLFPLLMIALGTFMLAGLLVFLIARDTDVGSASTDGELVVTTLGRDATLPLTRHDSAPNQDAALDRESSVDTNTIATSNAEAGERPRPTQPASRRVGTLSVSARGHAVIYLDGRRLGRTPLRGRIVAAGRHRLEVRGKNPRYTIRRSVLISAGGAKRLLLLPRKGRLRIRVEPWAKVWLDGRLLGTTPLPPVALWQGRHTLRLENSRLKRTINKRLWITPGTAKVVKVRLR